MVLPMRATEPLPPDCNFSIPIIAHGVGDSVDFSLMFLGKYPGM
jgi:hypothetical protein